MNRKFFFITAILILTLLLVSACTGLIPMTGPASGNQAATQQAYILAAAEATATSISLQAQIAQLQTQVAQGGSGNEPVVVSVTPEPALPTASPQPPTATAVPPTATPVPPTATPLPTWTPLPPTATPIPCNSAQFVADVSIPDGTTFSPGVSFTKIWRLKNTGSCTWTTSYDLVYTGGDSLSSPSVVALPGYVSPGQVIDVSVDFTTPSNEGHYRSNWKLRDGSGILFGVGKSGSSFYVDVKVATPESNYPMDFVASMCQASWTSGAGTLTCPGASGDSRGYVLRVDNPRLESGYQDNEPALVTYPQMVTDGIIRGKYPSYRVSTGQHFMAIIGCGYETDGCDVKFQLDYQIGSGSIQTLATWHEVYDKQYRSVDVDLSSLAGKDVKFILTVLANGSSNQDRAQWLAPRIVKK